MNTPQAGGAGSWSSSSSAEVQHQQPPFMGSAVTIVDDDNLGHAALQSPSTTQSVYRKLPTYRFPPPPPSTTSAYASNLTQGMPPTLLADGGPGYSAIPMGPISVSTRKGGSESPIGSPHDSSLSSSLSPGGPELAYNSSSASSNVSMSSGPPLPMVSLDAPQEYRTYDAAPALGPSLFVESEPFEVATPRDHEDGFPVNFKQAPNDFLGITYAPGTYPQHPAFATTGPTTLSSFPVPMTPLPTSTYVPSSAYLPSKSTFAGLTPQLPSLPRSAPSTPLGRQDARFLSSLKGSSLHGWSTPQIASVETFHPDEVTSPLMITASNFTGASPTFAALSMSQSSSYHPTDSYLSSSMTEADFDGRTYIPYARTPKASPSKRLSPFPYSSPISDKKSKRDQIDLKFPRERIISSTNNLGAGHQAFMDENQRPKPQRCKIACSSCRKTRLKCDGKRPCTSCVDKYLKTNPTASEEDGIAYVDREGSCQYENFVRRRGKGKKTIEKEKEERLARQSREKQALASSVASSVLSSDDYPSNMPFVPTFEIHASEGRA